MTIARLQIISLIFIQSVIFGDAMPFKTIQNRLKVTSKVEFFYEAPGTWPSSYKETSKKFLTFKKVDVHGILNKQNTLDLLKTLISQKSYNIGTRIDPKLREILRACKCPPDKIMFRCISNSDTIDVFYEEDIYKLTFYYRSNPIINNQSVYIADSAKIVFDNISQPIKQKQFVEGQFQETWSALSEVENQMKIQNLNFPTGSDSLTEKQIKGEIVFKSLEVISAVRDFLKKDSLNEIKIWTSLTLGQDGRITHYSCDSSSFQNEFLIKKISETIKNWKFQDNPNLDNVSFSLHINIKRDDFDFYETV